MTTTVDELIARLMQHGLTKDLYSASPASIVMANKAAEALHSQALQLERMRKALIEIERLCGCPKPNLNHIWNIAARERSALGEQQ